MSNELNEKLSALMDDEHDVSDLDEGLKSLCQSERKRRHWERLHLVRDVMQNEFGNHLDRDFASRVSAAIELEATSKVEANVVSVDFSTGKKARQWMRPLGGLAIAATVAAVSILGLRYLQPIDPTAPQLASNNSAGQQSVASATILPPAAIRPSASDFRLVDNTGTYWMVDKRRVSNAAMEERLNTFLSDHTEFATARSVGGMLPYSRIVGYDEVRK